MFRVTELEFMITVAEIVNREQETKKKKHMVNFD